MTSPCEPTLRRTTHRRHRGGCRGFTLIELLVVLAILGLALGLFASYRPHTSSTLGLNGAAIDLAAGLRLARSQAIVADRAVGLELDPGGHRYRVGAAPSQPLPADLSLRLLTVAGERRGSGGVIRFNPDGSSTGGGISIADGRRRIVIAVDWLTGRVDVADAR